MSSSWEAPAAVEVPVAREVAAAVVAPAARATPIAVEGLGGKGQEGSGGTTRVEVALHIREWRHSESGGSAPQPRVETRRRRATVGMHGAGESGGSAPQPRVEAQCR
ncbi:hypothetical protein U1Q18_033059 [Sarracenia purpurea var. burkii]